MLVLVIALAVAQPAPAPSKAFIQACFERANGQAELDFCSAGQAESEKHKVEDAEAVACFDKAINQMSMNMCAGEEYGRADKALNEQWAKAKVWAKDDPQTGKLLLESQRAWLKFRDAHCELVSDQNRGGSIVPLIHGKCLTGLTIERTEALANLMKPWDQ